MSSSVFSLASVLALGAFAGSAEASCAGTELAVVSSDEVKISGQIHYGKLRDFDPKRGDKVGTLRPRDVYEQIPAYQEIVKEKIEKGSARYNKLIEQATNAYKKAVKAVGDGGFVLIVEEGGVSGYPATDLTSQVITAL